MEDRRLRRRRFPCLIRVSSMANWTSDYEFRTLQFSIWHWAICRSTIELSRRSAILGGGRHREESAAGHFLNDERGRMKDERRLSF